MKQRCFSSDPRAVPCRDGRVLTPAAVSPIGSPMGHPGEVQRLVPGPTWPLCPPAEGSRQLQGHSRCLAGCLAGGQEGGDPGPHCLSLPSSLCFPTLGHVPVLLSTGVMWSLSPAQAELGRWNVPLRVRPWLAAGLVTVTLCQLLGQGPGPWDSTGIPEHSCGWGPHTFAMGISLRAAATGCRTTGHLALCRTAASPRPRSLARLTLLSALPPRVPRG